MHRAGSLHAEGTLEDIAVEEGEEEVDEDEEEDEEEDGEVEEEDLKEEQEERMVLTADPR